MHSHRCEGDWVRALEYIGEPQMLRGLRQLALILALVCGASRLHASPLHDAAQAGDLAQAGLLIMDDPSAVNVRDKRGFTPLSMAAQSGHVAVVKLLVEKGAAVDAKVNYPGAPAPVVAFYADPATVKLLTIKAPLKALGATPLYIAAKEGHVAVAKVLLDNGAAIDAKADDAGAPLSIAARNGHLEMVKLLLEQGAAVDGADASGSTPLYFAAKEGHAAVVALLLDRGAAIEGTRNDRSTPLAVAAQHAQLNVVQVLLEKGAVVDAKTRDGFTPLARAAQNREGVLATRLEVMKLLLAKGANPRTPAFAAGGKTALQLADERGDVEIAELLREAGA